MDNEPVMDVAHLGHVELLTPAPKESLRLFADIMGMTESGLRADLLRGRLPYSAHLLHGPARHRLLTGWRATDVSWMLDMGSDFSTVLGLLALPATLAALAILASRRTEASTLAPAH